MNVKLYGSFNSRFFGVLTSTEIRLYRGIAAGGDLGVASNEAQLVFSRALDQGLGLNLIRVSNQGDLFFLGPRGLFRLRNDRNAKLEIVNESLCALARGDDVARLGQVRTDVDGREIFYEVISPDAGLKDRLRKLWRSKSEAETIMAHQIVNINLATMRKDQFPPTAIDTRRDFAFRWNISPSGRFLVQARPEKKNYHLDVIDISNESIIADFQMALANINELWVNDAGVIMVDIRQVGEEKIIIALPDGVTRHPFCPPPGYQLVHLGPLHIAMILDARRRLQIYDYSGKLISDVDYQPLLQMQAQFHFNFNDRGQIDILLWHNGSLHLQHSDIKSILVDAKRWSLTARQAQTDEQQRMVQQVTTQHQDEQKRLEDVLLSRQLLDAIQSQTPSSNQPVNKPRLGNRHNPLPPPAPIPAPINAIPEIPKTPEISDGIIETPPWMAGLSSPEPPATSSTIPPPSVTSLEPLPSPKSSSPAKPLHIDRNTPPPVLPSRPTNIAAKPPTSLPSSLPSPDADEATLSPQMEATSAPSLPLPLPATDSTPLPAPSSSTLPNFSTPAEIDNELERLRMTYIAGEISRDLYYSRRSELEQLRRVLTSSTLSASSGLKHLELELPGKDPSINPPPRPKNLNPPTELPLPLPEQDQS